MFQVIFKVSTQIRGGQRTALLAAHSFLLCSYSNAKFSHVYTSSLGNFNSCASERMWCSKDEACLQRQAWQVISGSGCGDKHNWCLCSSHSWKLHGHRCMGDPLEGGPHVSSYLINRNEIVTEGLVSPGKSATLSWEKINNMWSPCGEQKHLACLVCEAWEYSNHKALRRHLWIKTMDTDEFCMCTPCMCRGIWHDVHSHVCP